MSKADVIRELADDMVWDFDDHPVTRAAVRAWLNERAEEEAQREWDEQELRRILVRVEEVVAWLERGKGVAQPLSVLEQWDVPTADQQGYLAGLNAAAARLRFVLRGAR